jgi:hypothetical protein
MLRKKDKTVEETTERSPWSLERVGHPHLNIAIRHHNNGGVSQVFDGEKMRGHFAGQNAERDARRHAMVLISSRPNPNEGML